MKLLIKISPVQSNSQFYDRNILTEFNNPLQMKFKQIIYEL